MDKNRETLTDGELFERPCVLSNNILVKLKLFLDIEINNKLVERFQSELVVILILKIFTNRCKKVNNLT